MHQNLSIISHAILINAIFWSKFFYLTFPIFFSSNIWRDLMHFYLVCRIHFMSVFLSACLERRMNTRFGKMHYFSFLLHWFHTNREINCLLWELKISVYYARKDIVCVAIEVALICGSFHYNEAFNKIPKKSFYQMNI